MTPMEYCERWIPIKTGLYPGDWGFRAACDRELSSVTGFVVGTIKGWGKNLEGYPPVVAVLLKYRDALNRIEIITEEARQSSLVDE